MTAFLLILTILSGSFTAINVYTTDYATATAQAVITVASALLFTKELRGLAKGSE